MSITLTVKKKEEDKRDLYNDFIKYLNSKFKTQEDMEQRINVHAMNFAQANGAKAMIDNDGNITIDATGLAESSKSGPRIKTTYGIVTPESAERGDFDETGWEDEVGYDCTPDKYDLEDGKTAVDCAVEFLKSKGSLEASSSVFYKGIWYSQSDGSQDYKTGAVTTYSFHLDGFSEDQEKEIHKRITGLAESKSDEELYAMYDNMSNDELRDQKKAAIELIKTYQEKTDDSAEYLLKDARRNLAVINKVMRDGGLNEKKEESMVNENWLPRKLSKEVEDLVPEISNKIGYDIEAAKGFCVALLEDVNAHPEAAAVNALLSDFKEESKEPEGQITEAQGFPEEEEIVSALVAHFVKEDDAEKIEAAREEISNSLELDKGAYSSFGNCGSFEYDGIEYNIIPNENEAHEIALELVKQDAESEPELFNQDFAKQFLTIDDTTRRTIAIEEADARLQDIDYDITKERYEDVFDTINKSDEWSDWEEKIQNAEDEGPVKEELEAYLKKAAEEWSEEYIEELEQKLEDPIGYFVDELGAYTVEDLMKSRFVSIDTDEMAKEAVEADGWEHFLSRYDGEYETISNGMVIFREN